jgi:hypothetical protein
MHGRVLHCITLYLTVYCSGLTQSGTSEAIRSCGPRLTNRFRGVYDSSGVAGGLQTLPRCTLRAT